MTTGRKANKARHGRLMSLSTAARAMGVHRNTVLARVAEGVIESDSLDGRVVVVRASVEAYARRQAEALSVAS